MVGTPDPETIRTYFKEELCVEDLPKLAEGLNAALAGKIPPRVWRQPRDGAMDFHDRPYYGKTPQAECRTRAERLLSYRAGIGT